MSDRVQWQSVLDCLVNLQANHDRVWFEQQRDDYQQAKEQFIYSIWSLVN
ncbi:MAG: hypothetical protein KME45_08105 [Stenomitos rutilans HA7619-LM2]|jgi:hypothetical protein|nr:hypothetical protein [Stenomitos rutilans HA7619-LM2]